MHIFKTQRIQSTDNGLCPGPVGNAALEYSVGTKLTGNGVQCAELVLCYGTMIHFLFRMTS